ncbi:MAG: NAD-dependent epimerase/dehydratase family protein [Candidatus Paceibacterota bacterium]|jgi:UDP-glucose 4-epimerase
MTTQNGYPIADKTILLTGGCGFIGGHMAEALLRRGARKVVIIDSLEYGKESNITVSPQVTTKVPVIEFSLGYADSSVLRDIFKKHKIDYLIHLAAEKHNQSKKTPQKIFLVNILGTQELFEIAAQEGVQKIIFASSLYAYGRRHKPKYQEEETPLPDTVYGISKLAGEHLLGYIAAKYGTSWIALRYHFVYGPRQYAGSGYKSVILKNFQRILEHQPPLICGDGKQALDYIYITDAVEATLRALERNIDSEIVNVSSGSATSIIKLTDSMLKVARSPLVPVHVAKDETHGTFRVGNNSKMKRLLSFKPTVSLQEGLSETFAWIKKSQDSKNTTHED